MGQEWRGDCVVKPLRVLIGCERSGVVRRAFRALGHDAWSCDLEPAGDDSHYHHTGDVFEAIDNFGPWDILIAHPPCDYLTNSAAWAYRDPDFTKYPGVGYHQKVKPGILTGKARREARDEAVSFFLALWHCGIPRICIENPIGHMNTHPDLPNKLPGRQIVQPYQFGDDASKATCLWLKGLPPLIHTCYYPPRFVCDRCRFTFPSGVRVGDGHSCPECGRNNPWLPRWSNQTDSGQNKINP